VGGGTILHWNGSAWAVTATPADLIAVHAVAANQVWAAGTAGAIMHWDGTSWTSQASGTTMTLAGVWSAGGSAWAVGQAGTILDHH